MSHNLSQTLQQNPKTIYTRSSEDFDVLTILSRNGTDLFVNNFKEKVNQLFRYVYIVHLGDIKSQEESVRLYILCNEELRKAWKIIVTIFKLSAKQLRVFNVMIGLNAGRSTFRMRQCDIGVLCDMSREGINKILVRLREFELIGQFNYIDTVGQARLQSVSEYWVNTIFRNIDLIKLLKRILPALKSLIPLPKNYCTPYYIKNIKNILRTRQSLQKKGYPYENLVVHSTGAESVDKKMNSLRIVGVNDTSQDWYLLPSQSKPPLPPTAVDCGFIKNSLQRGGLNDTTLNTYLQLTRKGVSDSVMAQAGHGKLSSKTAFLQEKFIKKAESSTATGSNRPDVRAINSATSFFKKNAEQKESTTSSVSAPFSITNKQENNMKTPFAPIIEKISADIIPLTTAGKVFFSQYPDEALEFAYDFVVTDPSDDPIGQLKQRAYELCQHENLSRTLERQKSLQAEYDTQRGQSLTLVTKKQKAKQFSSPAQQTAPNTQQAGIFTLPDGTKIRMRGSNYYKTTDHQELYDEFERDRLSGKEHPHMPNPFTTKRNSGLSPEDYQAAQHEERQQIINDRETQRKDDLKSLTDTINNHKKAPEPKEDMQPQANTQEDPDYISERKFETLSKAGEFLHEYNKKKEKVLRSSDWVDPLTIIEPIKKDKSSYFKALHATTTPLHGPTLGPELSIDDRPFTEPTELDLEFIDTQ